MTPEQAYAAARKGAAWMDAHCPTWVDEIDTEKLDLSDLELCILGQTAECLVPEDSGARACSPDAGCEVCAEPLDYHHVTSYYWAEIEDAGETVGSLGFSAPITARADTMETDYEMLTIAWRQIIRERIAALVPA
jgi:hypothetical protein